MVRPRRNPRARRVSVPSVLFVIAAAMNAPPALAVPVGLEKGDLLTFAGTVVEEVRRRKALERDGRRWDLFVFGLLQAEWLEQVKA